MSTRPRQRESDDEACRNAIDDEDQLGKLKPSSMKSGETFASRKSVGQLTNNARIRTIRKDLARILTIRHERVLDVDARQLSERDLRND